MVNNMKAVSEEYARLNEIARSKIPVSEDSPIYNFFAERRKIAEKLRNNMITEENRQNVINYLEKIEEQIKAYLLL